MHYASQRVEPIWFSDCIATDVRNRQIIEFVFGCVTPFQGRLRLVCKRDARKGLSRTLAGCIQHTISHPECDTCTLAHIYQLFSVVERRAGMVVVVDAFTGNNRTHVVFLVCVCCVFQ